MTVRKTLKWMLVIVLLGGVCLGGYGYWLFASSDEMLRQMVLDKLAEIAPDWDIEIGRARFDWNRRVRIYNVALKLKGQRSPIVTLPEIMLTVDREKLTNQQKVVVRRIRLLRPFVNLVRASSGTWNFEPLPAILKSNKSCPEWELQEATVRIQLDHSDSSAAGVLTIEGSELKLIPSGKRRYLVKALMQVNHAGTLNAQGEWEIDAKSWTINGQMKGVTSGGELLGLAAAALPELRAKLGRIDATLRQTQAKVEGSALESGSPNAIPHLDLAGKLDVNFNISRRDASAEPEFKLLVTIRQGRLRNSALPFSLHDLEGSVYWDNRRILIQNLTAKNGVTRIALEGKMVRQQAAMPGWFQVGISNLVLDERLQSRLPFSLRKVYNSISPAGEVDVQLRLHYDGLSRWQTHDLLLTARGCSCAHVKFPYRVTNVVGTIKQREQTLDLAFQGRAGRRPVTLEGYVKNPGPTARTVLDVRFDRVPLDDKFWAACPPPVQKTLTSLKLKGHANGRFRVSRPAGLNQKFHTQLVAQLNDGSLEYEWFPYRLKNLTGTVTHSSVENIWTFHDLRAVRGTARFSASGSFAGAVRPGELKLTVTAIGADFDRQLQLALPESLQQTWQDFSPTGKLNVVVNIHWVPGRPVEIALPEIEVTGGSMLMKQFPYPLQDVHAKMAYADEYLEIKSFSGRHDRTKLRGKGFLRCPPRREWRLRLVELSADDLIPDHRFRQALPEELRQVVDELNPKHPISFSGMLELRGTNRPGDPVTAAWDMQAHLSGNSLTTGVDLENVHGRVTARGTLDHRGRVNMGGQLDLDSLVVWDYQLTQLRGPYEINDNQLIVGSREVLLHDPRRRRPRQIPLEDHVTARAIDGILTLDAAAVLQSETSYHVRMTMSQGRLEQYAKRYLPGVRNVRGVMNGWIDLHGRGSSPEQVTGRGQLQISPAALYELPVMVQVFNVLSFVPPDRTAFTYALLDFVVGNGQFRFNSIDLVGDAISLRGRGTARFDGRLNLNFYSMLSRGSQVPIPVLRELLGTATSGWVGVAVRGKVSAPLARIRAVPQLDDALRRFLAAFEARPRNVIPRLTIPPLFPVLPSRMPQPLPRPQPEAAKSR